MKLFLLIIIAAAVLFAAWCIVTLIRDNRNLTRTIRREGFTDARIYRPRNVPACAAFDDRTRRVLLVSENQTRIIPYDRLAAAKPFVQSDQVKRSILESDVLFGAYVGDALYGGKGAVVGALMGMNEHPKPRTETRYNRIGVDITAYTGTDKNNTETFTVFFLGDSRADAHYKNDSSVARDSLNDYIRCAQAVADEVHAIVPLF